MQPSRLFSSTTLASLLLAAVSISPAIAETDADSEQARQLETVTVTASGLGDTTENTGSYTTGAMKSATGLDLSIKDTPQSVSVVTTERIKDQNMKTVSDALQYTTGVSVKPVDRGRNNISVRGFDVTNFQLDGIPVTTGNVGLETSNTVLYDRIEVVPVPPACSMARATLPPQSTWCASTPTAKPSPAMSVLKEARGTTSWPLWT